MYILTSAKNKYLAIEINENFDIKDNDITISNLNDNDLYIGVDDINSSNYINLLNFTNLNFKDLYQQMNPNKKFMEQKKNKSRRVKSIYNLVKQIIDSDKFNLKSFLLNKANEDSKDESISSETELSLSKDDLSDDKSISSETESISNETEVNLSEDKSINTDVYLSENKLDNLVVLSKTGLFLYSAFVLFTGVSFGFYFQKFKR